MKNKSLEQKNVQNENTMRGNLWKCLWTPKFGQIKKPAAMAAAKNFLYFILCPLTHTTFIVRYCRNR